MIFQSAIEWRQLFNNMEKDLPNIVGTKMSPLLRLLSKRYRIFTLIFDYTLYFLVKVDDDTQVCFHEKLNKEFPSNIFDRFWEIDESDI